MKEYLIWSSDVNVEDYEDFLKEEYPEITDEYEKYTLCSEMNDMYFEDEMANLDINTNPIVCIADLGLWNGRRTGIKRCGNNVNSILCSTMNGNVKFFYDRYNVKGTEYHHDGTNYYVYREIKGNTYEEQERNYNRLLNAVLENTLTSSLISRCTRSIRDYVTSVYGEPKVA